MHAKLREPPRVLFEPMPGRGVNVHAATLFAAPCSSDLTAAAITCRGGIDRIVPVFDEG